MRRALAVLVAAVATVLLIVPGNPGVASGASSMVNVQVTASGEFEYVRAMMDELVRRGIKATLWVTEVEQSPELRSYIGELSRKGYEIGVRLEQELTALPYERQLEMASEVAGAIRACTGRAVKGLRATRFTWNEHTVRVVEELKFGYIMADIERTPERFGDGPYYPDGRGFGVLGVTRATYPDGSTGILCDAPAAKRMSAEEYQRLLLDVIDRRVADGKPMVFEWHPGSMSRPGDDNPWWDVFLRFLDYLQSKGGRVWFVTGQEMVMFNDPCQC